MHSEILKYVKNKQMIVTTILWIIGFVLVTPRNGTNMSSTGYNLFEGMRNIGNPYGYFFSSINAYVACLFIPALAFLLYKNDRRLYETSRINFLNQSIFKITVSKIVLLTGICMVVYCINLVLYGMIISFRFGINITEAYYLISFLSLKFLMNSFYFSSLLILSISLLKQKHQIIYFIASLLFIFFTIAFSNSYFTPFNWYVNSLGFLNNLRGNTIYRPIMDFRSELRMIPSVLLLIFIFYLKYENRKDAY